MLREQMKVTCQGMDAFVQWAGGDASADRRARPASTQADEKKRALWNGLRDAFTTPIDAEDLYTLSALLDTVLNGAKDIVREVEAARVRRPTVPSAEMAVDLWRASVISRTRSSTATSHEGDATRRRRRRREERPHARDRCTGGRCRPCSRATTCAR